VRACLLVCVFALVGGDSIFLATGSLRDGILGGVAVGAIIAVVGVILWVATR